MIKKIHYNELCRVLQVLKDGVTTNRGPTENERLLYIKINELVDEVNKLKERMNDR
jgi:hypothetical protein